MVWPKVKQKQKHDVSYKQTTRTWFLRDVWDSVDPRLLLVKLGFVMSPWSLVHAVAPAACFSTAAWRETTESTSPGQTEKGAFSSSIQYW